MYQHCDKTNEELKFHMDFSLILYHFEMMENQSHDDQKLQ
jgi:hypothetical protein